MTTFFSFVLNSNIRMIDDAASSLFQIQSRLCQKSDDEIKFEAQQKINKFNQSKEECDDYFSRKKDWASEFPNSVRIIQQITTALAKTYQIGLRKNPHWLSEYFKFSEQQQMDLHLNDSSKSILQLFR
jgi:hypothetical protein